ncbi:CPBP family intramembrane glutamic endopeptidase [uncultured Microbacterium sp.]|uniref:CPBP family intramembrane glutamic endopeptidase n=1 Tax=uncultured Microbacterium sp. TaxID=191216 RepID=UPI002624A16C|nr:CPBP family intramembrane glutamic endopeptidase [uncultured Microbacterium sp.]
MQQHPSSVSRSRLWWEIAIVLALSVGRSAVYSVLSLVEALTREESLGDQSTSLNPGANAQAFWDVVNQIVGQVFAFAPIALAIYFLWEPGVSAFRRIGLDLRRVGSDLARALLLVVVIGLPGLGLYAAGRALGITVQVDASPLDPSWWTIPLLLLAALRAGLTEEVIVIGYLFDRLRRLGWGTWTIILSTAALRGAYHAYQGFGPIVGNVAMGIVFGWAYHRWGRVMPLVLAHVLIDIIAFIGYPLAAEWWPALF